MSNLGVKKMGVVGYRAKKHWRKKPSTKLSRDCPGDSIYVFVLSPMRNDPKRHINKILGQFPSLFMFMWFFFSRFLTFFCFALLQAFSGWKESSRDGCLLRILMGGKFHTPATPHPWKYPSRWGMYKKVGGYKVPGAGGFMLPRP